MSASPRWVAYDVLRAVDETDAYANLLLPRALARAGLTGPDAGLATELTYGDGAKTGAGAVIRKDVPPGALALSVAPQRNVEGWVENHRPGTAAAAAAARSRTAQEADHGAQEAHG